MNRPAKYPVGTKIILTNSGLGAIEGMVGIKGEVTVTPGMNGSGVPGGFYTVKTITRGNMMLWPSEFRPLTALELLAGEAE